MPKLNLSPRYGFKLKKKLKKTSENNQLKLKEDLLSNLNLNSNFIIKLDNFNNFKKRKRSMEIDEDFKPTKFLQHKKKKFAMKSMKNRYSERRPLNENSNEMDIDDDSFDDDEYMNLKAKKTTKDTDSDDEDEYENKTLYYNNKKSFLGHHSKKTSIDNNDILNPILKYLESRRRSSYEMSLN